MPTTEREPAPLRDHNTYKKDHWTVVDIDAVDSVFATPSSSDVGRDPDRVRIDLDGAFAESSMRDVGETGENANLSVWLSPEDAKALASEIIDALPID